MKDIQKPGKAAMLDAKAAEVRHFCTDLFEPLAKSKKLQEGSLREKAVYNVANHCTDMYKHLETFDSRQLVTWRWKVKLYTSTQRIAAHGGPSQSSTCLGTSFRKGHRPKDSWAYRDETLGYDFQKLFFKRGGKPKPGHQAEKVLLRWAQEEKFFCLKQALA